MKKTIKQLLFALLLGTVFVSCKKDENQIFFEGGTAPVMTSSATGPFVLNIAHKDDVLTTLRWTNPDYKFTTGVSSQDVYYTIQIDSVGKNFSSPGLAEISVPNELSKDLTVGELNAKLLSANWVEDVPGTVEMRVKSTLVTGAGALYSSAITLQVTPYLDVLVPVPTNSNLWITGDAVTSGWSNPLGAPFVSTQKFTKISSTVYKLTIAMPGGGGYKLLQDNGNWSTQYHMLAGGTWDNGSFEKRDADPQFPGPPSSGTYTITVNFKTGKFTVTQ